MAINAKEDLQQMRCNVGLLQKWYCSPNDENQYREMIKNGLMLPKGIQMDQTVDPSLASFYVSYDSGLSDDEKKEYIQLKQLSYVKTIKNCAVFFTTLTIITLVLGLIIPLVLLS